ncbi:phosphoribosylformylglycinamidine synthase subunit PurS, partial [Nakamurella sp.]
MARVAVDVVIKPEILDPQGKAILAALGRSGHAGITAVRQGKHF